ncbi:MAG: Tad domain-containing protein [Actinomycetota bacterium]
MSVTPRRPLPDETGAVLPIIAILIVVLLIFAAFTVDLGAAWSQRRQNQSAADAGVMAGALNYVTGEGTTPLVIARVQEYVNTNVEPDVTAADWAGCADTAVDGVDFVALDDSVTECISISVDRPDRTRVLRVKLPDRYVETSFAGIIGIDTIATGAFAEADMQPTLVSGSLPFVLPTGSGHEYCIGDVPGGLANDPCKGPGRAKFGDIDSPTFGSEDPGTKYCDKNDNLNYRLALNTAIGIDHVLSSVEGNDTSPPPEDGADRCTSPGKEEPPYVPYALVLGEGSLSALKSGIAGPGPFGTFVPEPGRLRQGSGPWRTLPDKSAPGNSVSLDNVGLWEYLETTGSGDSCDGGHGAYVDVATDGPLATKTIGDCLRGSGSTPQFTPDILESPRFAFVPRVYLNEALLDGAGPGTIHNIKEFVPVYLQTTFWTCSAADASCMAFEAFGDETPDDPSDDRQFFSPGEGDKPGCVINPGSGECVENWNSITLSINGLSAFALNWDWLPEGASGEFDGPPISVLLHR